MTRICIILILLVSVTIHTQAQDPITLIAGTLIPKLVEGTNAVIDKVKENKEAKNNKKEKTQKEVDKALQKLQQDNAENLSTLSASIRKSNDKITELKKIYATTKEMLYPLGSLQSLTDSDLHDVIIGSTDMKKVVISRYLTTWNDMKPYYDNVVKLQEDEQWTDESNKIALTNDVKTVFSKLHRINGVVTKIKEPAPASTDAEIEQYRKAIAGSSAEITEAKNAVIEILDLLTARLSLNKNEADDLVHMITAQKDRIMMPK